MNNCCKILICVTVRGLTVPFFVGLHDGVETGEINPPTRVDYFTLAEWQGRAS